MRGLGLPSASQLVLLRLPVRWYPTGWSSKRCMDSAPLALFLRPCSCPHSLLDLEGPGPIHPRQRRRGFLLLREPTRLVQLARVLLVLRDQLLRVGLGEADHAHLFVGLLDLLAPQSDVLDRGDDPRE